MAEETKKLKDHIQDFYHDVDVSPDLAERLSMMPEQKLAEETPRPTPIRKRHRSYFSLAQVAVLVAIISILSLISIPNFISLRARAYGASAKSAGRNAVLAVHVLHGEGRIPGELVGRPAQPDEPAKADGAVDILKMLLSYDRNLTDDPDVTFTFMSMNASGYSFETRHENADTPYEFEGPLPPKNSK